MSDPFRQFFLDSIQNTLEQEAGEKALLALFRFVSPSLSLDDMLAMEPRERKKLMKILKSRIHPDKHPQSSTVTTIFQNVQNFYSDCIASLESTSASSSTSASGSCDGTHLRRKKSKTRKRHHSSHLSSTESDDPFPRNFCTFSHWPITQTSISDTQNSNDQTQNKMQMQMRTDCHPSPPDQVLPKNMVSAFQAYKCIHARGAIAHGRPITKFYSWHHIQQDADNNRSVRDIFDQFGTNTSTTSGERGSGTRELDSIQLIKEEIMTRGPVVSVSFRLSEAYLSQLRTNTDAGDKAFADDLVGGIHELLIVGWCLTPYGEAWQVLPLMDAGVRATANSTDKVEKRDEEMSVPLLRIGFGQFGIDEEVLAPESNLENVSWQPGPYFDSDFSDIENWRNWEQMDLPITEGELVSLGRCFKNGLFSGETFVLRDETKKAQSASYTIKNIKWIEETQEWFVTINKTEKEA